MTQDLKILHLIDRLNIGGAQRLLEVFAKADPQKTMHVLSMGERDEPFVLRLANSDATVQVEQDCRLWHPSTYFRIFRAVGRVKPDVVHLHLTYATIIGAVAGKLCGCAVVTSIHSTQTAQNSGQRRRFLRFLETWAIRLFVDRVIFVSKMAAEANEGRFGRTPTVTIDNVVEPPDLRLRDHRDATRAALGAADTDVVVLSTGRLHWTKNIANLLTAFAQVVWSRPNAKLWICGSGPLAADLHHQAASLDLGGSVSFLGNRSDIPTLLQAADIFALTSDTEALPLALLEAMAAGLPVVVTSVGSMPEYVEGGSGLIVPPRRVPELAAALDQMVGDAGLRQRASTAASARARDFTDIGKWRRALEAEYLKASQS